MNTFDAEKYLKAQNRTYGSYEQALTEIRNGRKTTHWIWYVFPQIAGLGQSSTSRLYAIGSLDEAKQYLANDTLRSRLVEISEALLLHEKSAREIMGSPDDMKLRSSMTLFQAADPGIEVFGQVLDKFFSGQPDRRTLQILARQGGADAKAGAADETHEERVLREAEEYGVANIDRVSFEVLEKTVAMLREMEKEGKISKGTSVPPGMQLVATEEGPKVYSTNWCGQF